MSIDEREVQGLTEKLLAFGEALPPGQQRIFWEMLERAVNASSPAEDTAAVQIVEGAIADE